jgi:hypothetical protein
MLDGPYRSPWGTQVWSDPDAPPIAWFGVPPGVSVTGKRDCAVGAIEYESYLRSREWGLKSADARRRAGYRCQRCGAKGQLDVHHKHYRTLGNEAPEDLEVLCVTCHEGADKQRERETEQRRWGRRLDAWASKKYGEGWADQGDGDSIAEEFDGWLDSRD